MRFMLIAVAVVFAAASPAVAFQGFERHLNCPFSKVWLEHGPERAAEILGVDKAHAMPPRRLDEATKAPDTYKCTVCQHVYDPSSEGGTKFEDLPASWKCPVCGAPKSAYKLVAGQWKHDHDDDEASAAASFASCSYMNPFANANTCFELRGGAWTDATAKARCDAAMANVKGTLLKAGKCTDPKQKGWCMSAKNTEASLATGASCAEAKTACESWTAGGVFECTATGAASAAPGAAAQGDGGGFGTGRCAIAPGPIGAAHQLGASPGYATDCKGTPAEGSKFMWPLRWTASVQSQSMKFGSDDIQYSSQGRVWYRLDKNWKRYDIHSENGTLRAIGQAPCETQEAGSTTGTACVRENDGSHNKTILHRGSKMVFIDYASDGSNKITKCSWMDLSMIGNIRPDWFLDKRGDSTDVQYIGDSHVYHDAKPRLVKQWRKKDFANQYFTMSMQRIADTKDKLASKGGVHWPLILNIPGEGFGDDQLQHYSNHRLLEEADEAPFLLEEAFIKAGGSCPKAGGGSSMSGPPTGSVDHVPSNLEKDPASWRSIEHTESPVWKPSADAAGSCGGGAGAQQPSKDFAVSSCWEEATKMVRIDATWTVNATTTPPWAAIGYRTSAECLMTPRGGADGETVFIQPSAADGAYQVKHGMMPKSLKSFGGSVNTFSTVLKPLAGVANFADPRVEMNAASGTLSLGYARAYKAKPDNVYLTFAVGNTGGLAYHKSRGCFTLAAAHLGSCKASLCPTCAASNMVSANLRPNGAAPTTAAGMSTVIAAAAVALAAMA